MALVEEEVILAQIHQVTTFSMRRYLSYLLSLFLLISCNYLEVREDFDVVEDDTKEYTRLRMFTTPATIEDDSVQTKIDVDWGASEINFPWAATDVVGIFPASGSQLYFSMANGVGTNYASFDGGGWALIRTADYYSYFPFVPDFYIDKEAIPFTYIGQEQNGNADPSKAQLGEYCHQVAKGEYNAQTQTLDFGYQRLGALFRFRIPVDAGVYESLTIEVEDNLLASEGTFKAINIDGKLYNTTLTDNLMMSFKNVSFETSGELIAFMMLPPFAYLHKQLNMILTKTDGTVVKASGLGQNFEATKAYGYKPKYSVYAKNEIIDGKGGATQVVITASGSDTYSVSTDVDWLTLDTNPTSGSAVINVTASKGVEVKRTGHVIVSREQTYLGETTKLEDKVEIIQDLIGTQMGLGNWESDGVDYGGTAR